MCDIVAYYRVSTKRQGQSGLGLDAQRAAVATYATSRGVRIIREFTEIESGRHSARPQLAEALPFARRAGAVLVVAKLDRLARNVVFLGRLMESGVDFVACDLPAANRLTIHILAAVAEAEAVAISERTRVALAEARKRGVLLGSSRPGHWDGHEQARLDGGRHGREIARRVTADKARVDYADLVPRIQALRQSGLSLARIAAILADDGHKTRRGAVLGAMQIRRILARATPSP